MNPFFRLPALCGLLLLAAASSPRFLAAAPAASPLEKPLADTLAPVLTCPASLTITLGAGRCDTFFQYTLTLTDNEPGATFTQLSGTPPAGAALAVGKTVNLFHAADATGNTATCVFSVRVKHPTVPLACRDTLTVPLDANCSFSVQYLDFLSGSGYGCAQNFTLEMDTLLPLGDGPWLPPLNTLGGRKSLLGYRVSDAATASKCSGYLRLRDTMPPKLTCPDIETSVLLSSWPYALDGYEIPGAFPITEDNCTKIRKESMTYTDKILSEDKCAQVHSKTSRTWVVKDKQGNSSSCTQIITLLNHDLSEVQFPADDTIGCSYPWYPALPLITFDGIGLPITYPWNLKLTSESRDSVLSSTCEGAQVLLRTWTVTDMCAEKTRESTQIIHVQDKAKPVVYCKPTALLKVESVDGCTGTVDLPDLVLDDGCSRVASATAFWSNMQGKEDSLAGTLTTFPQYNAWRRDTLGHFDATPDFPLGQTLVTFVAADPCGNTGTCATRVSVLDNTPPTAACDTLITVFLGKNGKAQLSAAKLNTASYDNCTAPNLLEYRAQRTDGNTCSPSALYDVWARFCCADIGDTVPVTLRVYDINLDTDTISANRFAGQHSDCTARVLVRDSLPPICSPMPDVQMACAAWRDEFSKFDPHQFTSCSTDSVLVVIDTSLMTPCGTGKIVRKVSVFNAQGQHTGTCKQTVSIYQGLQFFVKFPDDTGSYGKCPNAVTSSQPQLFTNACGPVDISYTDSLLASKSYDDCFGTIRRRWLIKYPCSNSDKVYAVPNPDGAGGPIVSYRGTKAPWTPTVALVNGKKDDFWWYHNSSGYQYDQYITLNALPMSTKSELGGTGLLGTVPYIPDSTLNDGLLWNHALFGNPAIQGNDLSEVPADLSFSIRDSCGMRQAHIAYQLNLDLDSDGIRETKVPVSSDNSSPSGGVSFNNNKPGSTSTWTVFDQRPVLDSDKYAFDLDIDTAGDLFTAHAVWSYGWGATRQSVPMQLPHGQHEIIWSIYDNCYGWQPQKKSLLFTVGPANPAQHKVSGHVRTELNIGVEDVKMSLLSPTLSTPGLKFTDDAGTYQFGPPLFESLHYSIAPDKDQNPLNGVSTFDLTIISKHILGLESIASPYRIIAADANRSGSVTTFDIVELRKLILGIYPKLPNAPSWRFVPKSFVFLQPDNPFVKGFPEKIERPNLPADRLDEDFVGIKVGDLNGSVTPNAQGQPEDRSGSDPVALETDDRTVQPGETFSADFWVKKPVAGYQLTLETPGLSLLDVEPGPGMSLEHFAMQSAALAVSFEAARGRETHFRVAFKAEKSGPLSQMLHLSDRIARSEAYPLGQPLPPAEMRLQMNPTAAVGTPQRGFEVFANQPNPFGAETLLPFYLPNDAPVTLTVYDPAGRIVLLHSAEFPQGFRSFLVKKRDLGVASGVLYYRIETPDGAGAGKMVAVE